VQQNSGVKKDLHAVTCTDWETCWAVGENVIVFTKDAGKTWEIRGGVGAEIVDFVNDNNGWIVKDEVLSRTNDGGVSWRVVADKTTNNGKYLGLFNSLKFVDSQNGWAGGDEKLGFSQDGGKSWRVTEIAGADIVGIVANDKRRALAVNRGDYNYCTEDGGRSWTECFPAEWNTNENKDPKVFKGR
jgi:photosystem II stability/assembly factor-like uncharacterized protein